MGVEETAEDIWKNLRYRRPDRLACVATPQQRVSDKRCSTRGGLIICGPEVLPAHVNIGSFLIHTDYIANCNLIIAPSTPHPIKAKEVDTIK